MDYVINFYDAADLMTRERLFKPCFEYFHKNFTIKYLPVVLTQVKKSSKLINSGAINSFICRHFLKIANTNVFLDYPVETVEHIFKLDLMIYSEYQVFESIMKWVNKNEDSRKEVLPKLLTFVRWSFMDPGELSKVKDNELIKTLRDFDSIISSNGDCESNRTKQNYFASIQELDDPPKLRINIFDKDLFCLPIGDFTEDKTMSTEFVHGEHMSDILFKTGRDVYRVDWAKKTFTWFDTHIAYYPVINNAIVNFQDNRSQYSCYLDAEATPLGDEIPRNSYLLLEYNDGFIYIGETEGERKYFGIFPATNSRWFDGYGRGCDHEFHATILDKDVYVFTSRSDFFSFNMETRSYNKIELFKGAKDLRLHELILTSLHKEDDKIILIDKQREKFHVYCVKQKKWFKKSELVNLNRIEEGSNEDTYELTAFTSTFLSMKNIKPLFMRNFL
ncbi:uncharacterized protein LOC112538453 isoform X1 [Tetranychus urticae]|uniref:uncharacterized protein LOC112538453 isoform X1 n=1 Tax=Tetranychus urticae TaxID=32264 RepID=UPI00077BBAE7|nr:uncharacterized protein LOC112538453 isoform X1 [Tetranychus urticae]